MISNLTYELFNFIAKINLFKTEIERNILKNYQLEEKEQNEELDNFKKLFIKFCIFEVSEISEGNIYF